MMIRAFTIPLFLVTLATGANASTLTVIVDHRLATHGPLDAAKTVRATFADEPLRADVRVDIYAVPQLPSSGAQLSELRALPKDGWWKQLDWELVDLKTNREILATWAAVSTRSEERGPSSGDKTKAVDIRSLIGRFELSGTIAPGEYKLTASIAGLRSQPFVFARRTGREDDVRDTYLAAKAARTRDFPAYRALQLARVKENPTNAVAYLELADRALEQGTLAETMQYFDGAITAMERLIGQFTRSHPAWAKEQRAAWEPRAARIRALQRELPEYFAHRKDWRVATDPATGNYVIRSRRDDRLIREVPARR